jgi:hypothetical protein
MNQWYEWDDGWFTYYVNIDTGEKKFELEEGDELIPYNYKLDDFCWKVNKGE